MDSHKKYIRASDTRSYYHCHRRVWFDHFPLPDMEILEPTPFDRLLMEKGKDHEATIKSMLAKEHGVVEAQSNFHTLNLMRDCVDVIYQAELIDDNLKLIGIPDFLLKQTNGEYQAADAKFAREVNKEIKAQLAIYRKLLDNKLPAQIFLGGGDKSEVGEDAEQEAISFIAEMSEILDMKSPPDVRYGETKCNACPYNNHCKPQFEAKEELTLLYGIDSRSAPHLEAQGICTISDLAKAEPESIKDVPYLKGLEQKKRVVLQAKAYCNGKYYKINSIELPKGVWIHFDIEANPLSDNLDSFVYLWGFLKPPYTYAGFEYVWVDEETKDKEGWLNFLETIENYRLTFPALVLCHFANYEVQMIKKYAERYDMSTHPTVMWLLGDTSPLYDIQRPVKKGLVLPIASYGLKQICKHEGLVNFKWQDDESGSQWSVVKFEDYRREKNEENRQIIKKAILKYNFDDVLATQKLEEWLRRL
jgi:uncharacterized protein